ncbi:unnamed protein product [Rhizophagus irregularis]|nr:unnamed protein product [Rhizophagus irregularis]
MIAGWSKFVNSILLLNERTKINNLDERTSRTPRNLNETKRPGRTDKPNTQELERNKAIWTNEQKNWCMAVYQMIKICCEDFEAPEWCKIQDIQNFRITTNIFCL